MAANSWPGSLPRSFTNASYSETVANQLLRSENDYGPAKIRRRTTAAVWTQSGTMYFTRDQLVIFKSFMTSISGGASAFNFPAISASGYNVVRIKPETIKISGGNPIYQVSFEIEVLP